MRTIIAATCLIAVASAWRVQTGDAPKCFVDSTGNTVVQYLRSAHKSFKCTHNAANTACTCTLKHPTHHKGGCRVITHTDKSVHVVSGDCTDSGRDPIHGGWSNYGAYNTCSKTCGTGTQSRTRQCNSPAPKWGGNACAGSKTDTRNCNTHACPVDGTLSQWSSYGKCSKDCAGGTHTRTRKCVGRAHGGKDCSGALSQSKTCNTHQCPVDGKWGSWPSNIAYNPFPYNGHPYQYNKAEALAKCQAAGYARLADKWEGNGYQVCAAGWYEDYKGYYMKQGRHGCGSSNHAFRGWGPGDVGAYCAGWTKCNKECGGGTQYRKRKCLGRAHGGKDCVGSDTETRKCNEHKCPIAYNPWQPSNGHPYQFSSRSKAEEACHRGGYARLCTKAEVTGFELCAAGWLSDYKGYYMNVGRHGCGSGKGWRGWGNGSVGAYCCNPHVATYNPWQPKAGHPYQFSTRAKAEDACHRGGYARLCNKAESTGRELCAAGWFSDYKGYYMNDGRHGCGGGRGWRGWGGSSVGAYCCAPHRIAYNPMPYSGHPYKYSTRAEAEGICAQAGYERLCSKAEATGYELCAAGWYSDYKGYYMNTGRTGCGSGKGWRGWGGGSVGVYCCKGVTEGSYGAR